MGNEIVKYHNDLNTVALRKFTSEEMNLFFAMCHKVREQGDHHLEYSFDEIKELINYSSRSIPRFVNDIKKTYLKMLQLNFGSEDKLHAEYFNLFTYFKVDGSNSIILVSVNERWEYILNQLESNFTRFELGEFVDLKSTYSKTMYRTLKQFRSSGYVKIHIDEFRRILDIPIGYKMSVIDKRVLVPIEKELPVYFKSLRIEKIKAKKGRKIEFLEFHFDKEMTPKQKKEAIEMTNPVKENKTKSDDYQVVVDLFAGQITVQEARLLFEKSGGDVDLLKLISAQISGSSVQINNLVGYVLGVLKNGFNEPKKNTQSTTRVEEMPVYDTPKMEKTDEQQAYDLALVAYYMGQGPHPETGEMTEDPLI